jgi:uncharacterized protein (DUF2237 family)
VSSTKRTESDVTGLNVFGTRLEACSADPLTGFFRDGCCNTCAEDIGQHTICVEMNEEFLLFSRARGNDLIPDCCLAIAGAYACHAGSRPVTPA